jgi:hypothetical protein
MTLPRSLRRSRFGDACRSRGAYSSHQSRTANIGGKYNNTLTSIVVALIMVAVNTGIVTHTAYYLWNSFALGKLTPKMKKNL